MKNIALTFISFFVLFSGTIYHPALPPAQPVIFSYQEASIEVELDYEVLQKTLRTPFLTPNVPYTRLRALRDYRVEIGEELPALLQKSFSCLNNKIAVTPHEVGYNFRDFHKLLDLGMESFRDTVFTYTSRYCVRMVLGKTGYFQDDTRYPYYEFRFHNASDNKLIYILGYAHNLGFVSVKCKVLTPDGQTEMRDWRLSKINNLPVKEYLASSASQNFTYMKIWGGK